MRSSIARTSAAKPRTRKKVVKTASGIMLGGASAGEWACPQSTLQKNVSAAECTAYGTLCQTEEPSVDAESGRYNPVLFAKA
jgi:hypothetical protein